MIAVTHNPRFENANSQFKESCPIYALITGLALFALGAVAMIVIGSLAAKGVISIAGGATSILPLTLKITGGLLLPIAAGIAFKTRNLLLAPFSNNG